MNQVLVVFRKELRDAIRDRRSVLSALIFPLLTPLLLIFMFQIAVDEIENPPPMRVAIAGEANAPGLVEELVAHDVEVETMERDSLADAVRGRIETCAGDDLGGSAKCRSRYGLE